jgi:SAM-dependent methyltransferase
MRPEEVKGKSVIEVGSLDINGSLRSLVETLAPHAYIGVDIEKGPGVDRICDAHELLSCFGRETCDLLISTELLEHVRDWRLVISNFKHLVRPGGVVLVTTRSFGFPLHSFPWDYWRYEVSDLEAIWSDFVIESIETDPLAPGVFLKARKPEAFTENDLTHYPLYSMVRSARVLNVTDADMAAFKIRCTVRRLFSLIALPFSFLVRKVTGR